MKALFISNDSPPEAGYGAANTSYFRILIPMAFLIGAGHDITHQAVPPVFNKGVMVDTIDWKQDIPETVLVERMIWPERVKMLRLAGAKRIVLTFDDNYQLLPSYSAVTPFWKRALPGFLSALPLVDEIIVPSKKLANDFRAYNPHITYVPNYLDHRLWDGERRVNDKLTIGWGGSEQHLQSWTGSSIVPGLRRVLEARPNWQLVVYCPIVAEHLRKQNLPVEDRSWVSFEQWPSEVRGFDIGLAPLHGDYDRRRSFLKVCEYGLSGVPFIATDDDPYKDVMGGVKVRNRSQSWGETLETLMDNEWGRMSLAHAGRAWAEGFRMDRNVDVYERVLWEN